MLAAHQTWFSFYINYFQHEFYFKPPDFSRFFQFNLPRACCPFKDVKCPDGTKDPVPVEMIPKWSHSSCSLFSKVFWRIVLIPLLSKNNSFSSFNFEIDFSVFQVYFGSLFIFKIFVLSAHWLEIKLVQKMKSSKATSNKLFQIKLYLEHVPFPGFE